jgi:hypothetical protein
MNAGRIVIVAYKPHPGKLEDLYNLLKSHIAVLDAEGLVTMRKPIIAQSSDGTMIEVFEWKSSEAIDLAHTNPRVQKLWELFSGVCDYVPLSQIDEAKNLFSEFSPFDPAG